MIKVSGLTAANVRALRETLPSTIASGELRLTATTAVWYSLSASEALSQVEHAISVNPARGHPRASLHAVARKLRALEKEA